MKQSAGILVYRKNKGLLEVLLVHPGGPFWKNKEAGAWSIPKGEFEAGEAPLQAARREFEEETGLAINGDFIGLTPVKNKSSKIVYAWAVAGDLDTTRVVSNTFEMEWPPRTGKTIQVPEIDQAEWFSLEEAEVKINSYQLPLLAELKALLKVE